MNLEASSLGALARKCRWLPDNIDDDQARRVLLNKAFGYDEQAAMLETVEDFALMQKLE